MKWIAHTNGFAQATEINVTLTSKGKMSWLDRRRNCYRNDNASEAPEFTRGEILRSVLKAGREHTNLKKVYAISSTLARSTARKFWRVVELEQARRRYYSYISLPLYVWLDSDMLIVCLDTSTALSYVSERSAVAVHSDPSDPRLRIKPPVYRCVQFHVRTHDRIANSRVSPHWRTWSMFLRRRDLYI